MITAAENGTTRHVFMITIDTDHPHCGPAFIAAAIKDHLGGSGTIIVDVLSSPGLDIGGPDNDQD